MHELMYEFMQHSKGESLRDKTLKDYEVFLRTFFQFLRDTYPDIEEITDVTRDIVRAYEKFLMTKLDARGKVLSRSRRKRYLSFLRVFFLYLQKEERIFKNPTTNMAMPGDRKTIIKDVLTIEEMDLLLKACVPDSVRGLRDRALLELLYSSGVRSDELCNILLKDIDLDERVLFIRKGKGGVERLIPFGSSAAHWVLKYLKKSRPLIQGPGTEYLFVTMRGTRLTTEVVRRVVKEYAEKAGIEKNVHTHTFRHSCATHMLKGRADIRHVQKQLGHRSISSTEKYLKIEITDLKDVHERCHPREQESWGGNEN